MEKIKSICSSVVAGIKSHIKIVAIVLAVIVVAIVAVSFIGGGSDRAVKKYISAVNSCDDSKILKSMNTKAAVAWRSVDQDELDKFKDELDDVDDDDVKSFEEGIKKQYDSSDKGKTKVKLKKVIYTTKAKENKDIKKVVCKVSVTSKPDEEDEDSSDVWKKEKKFNTTLETYMTFYLYKNKVIGTSSAI